MANRCVGLDLDVVGETSAVAVDEYDFHGSFSLNEVGLVNSTSWLSVRVSADDHVDA